MRNIVILLFLIATLVSCKKTEPKFTNSGSLELAGTKYPITKARYSLDSVLDGVRYAHIDFSPAPISISDAGISGGGASYMRVSLLLETDTLRPGSISFAAKQTNAIQPYLSYFETISSDKKDTTRIELNSGDMSYSLKGDTMPEFFFNFKTAANEDMKGSYLGTMVKNSMVNADSIGYLKIDTIQTALGSANIWSWGNVFTSDFNYYEIELLSADKRLTDAGKLKNATVMYLGLFSSDDSFPTPGAYKVSRIVENNTLYYGHKVNNTYWGTYWQIISNSSIKSKANIIADSVVIKKVDGDNYSININVKDQLNKRVNGEYLGTLKMCNPYTKLRNE